MLAQIDRTKAPAPGAPPQVRRFEEQHPPNGMRAIVVENHKLPMVSVQVRFDHPHLAGRHRGLPGTWWASCSPPVPPTARSRSWTRPWTVWAQLNGASDGFFRHLPQEELPELMGLVSEVVTTPAFNAEEFEKARTRYASGLKMRRRIPTRSREAVSRPHLQQKTSLREVPTEATVAKITRANLVAYYERFFQPKQGYVVFVGDITEKEAMDAANERFGAWNGGRVESTIDANGIGEREEPRTSGGGCLATHGERPTAGVFR